MLSIFYKNLKIKCFDANLNEIENFIEEILKTITIRQLVA
jgi:hypothetical protein